MTYRNHALPSGRYVLNGSMIVRIEKTRTGAAIRMSDSHSLTITKSLKTDSGWSVTYFFKQKEHTATLLKAPLS